MQLFASYEELSTAGGGKNYVHMHARLVSWFTWGFYNLAVPIAMVPFVACCLYQIPFVGLMCYATTMLSCACSSLAWFITGIIWRWSTDGQFAVGTLVPSGKTAEEWSDITKAPGSLFQVSSGNFMYYYYLIVLIL